MGQNNSKYSNIPRVALVFFYILILYLYVQNRNFYWFVDNFNLLIHELGHIVFGLFGITIGFAGGTIFQVMLPICSFFIFLKQKDYFAISFSSMWLGTNMFNIARYIADAESQILPLISMGTGEPIHDWNYLLGHFGLLQNTMEIANGVYALGYVLLGGAVFMGIYFYRKLQPNNNLNVL